MRLIDADQFGVVSFQGKSEDFSEGVNFILEKIDNAPTVEERPHGEWKPHDQYGLTKVWYERYKCSNCNEYGWLYWNFCPNCGADMREGDENG